jgi:serine/threonine-protein kinase
MQPGTRLGHYQILSAIGKGGMGEVWRAQDTTLRREVAIKTLPEEFAKDPDRLGRFEREATLLASLNHPSIAAIHGLENHQGTRFLVLELVEGRTLTPPTGSGSEAVEHALRIALQIAEAVEFAHGKGVIHRDLKPANIKVTPEGRVKVLDFGLAKALAPAAPAVEDTPTITAMATEVGVIMGTPAYMSPEQARGDVTDPQSDIWSFGVVLYELLTGTSPFGRPSTAETLASVLGPPPDYTVLPPAVPASAHVLVRRCLEKDRKRRFHHMGDVRIALEEALASLAAGASYGPGTEARMPRRKAVAVGSAIALAALSGAAGWWMASRGAAETPGRVARLSIASMEVPRGLQFGMRTLAVSADGSRVAYTSTGRLLIRELDRTEAVVVPVLASNPFFSSNGEWVGFFGERGDLMKVPALGGEPVLVASTSERPGGGTWRADGAIVFATTEGLYQVAESGGAPRLLLKPDAARKERAYLWPQFLPGGRAVLFTIVPEGSIDGAKIAMLNLDTLQATEVLRGGSAPRYASTGHLLYASGPVLKAVAFDPGTQQTRGDPVSLPGIEILSSADNGAADFAVSDTGTLLFLPPRRPGQALATLSWFDRQGNEDPLPLAPEHYTYPRISPDGSRLALDIAGTNRDVWIWNIQRKILTRLTAGPTEDILPAWSPDGQRIYFSSNRTGTFDVYSQAADGASRERVEFSGPGTQMVSGFTPDGGRLLLVENFKDVQMLHLGQPNRLEPLLQSEFDEWLPAVSPDGTWVAYESNESGSQVEIFLRPFPNVGDRREKVSIAGGRYPRWGPKNSGELYYIDLNGNMMAASVETSPSLSVGTVTKLFAGEKPPRGITGRPYDVSPIDGRFLMPRPAGVAPDAAVNISVVLNWFHELRERVPIR